MDRSWKISEVYRLVGVRLGGDEELIQHWLKTENLGTGGVPGQQIHTDEGLEEVLAYLRVSGIK